MDRTAKAHGDDDYFGRYEISNVDGVAKVSLKANRLI